MELHVGDEWIIPNGDEEFRVKIAHLGVATEFLASGDSVVDPEIPRKLETIIFVAWLRGAKAIRVLEGTV